MKNFLFILLLSSSLTCSFASASDIEDPEKVPFGMPTLKMLPTLLSGANLEAPGLREDGRNNLYVSGQEWLDNRENLEEFISIYPETHILLNVDDIVEEEAYTFSLSAYSLPVGLQYLSICGGEKVTRLGRDFLTKFSGGTFLIELDISGLKFLEYIEAGFMFGSARLERISLPTSLETIEQYEIFGECPKLKEFIAPPHMKDFIFKFYNRHNSRHKIEITDIH